MPAQSTDTFDVVETIIDGIHAAIRSGALTGTELVQSYLDRIAAYDQAGPNDVRAVGKARTAAVMAAPERAAMLDGDYPFIRHTVSELGLHDELYSRHRNHEPDDRACLDAFGAHRHRSLQYRQYCERQSEQRAPRKASPS